MPPKVYSGLFLYNILQSITPFLLHCFFTLAWIISTTFKLFYMFYYCCSHSASNPFFVKNNPSVVSYSLCNKKQKKSRISRLLLMCVLSHSGRHDPHWFQYWNSHSHPFFLSLFCHILWLTHVLIPLPRIFLLDCQKIFILQGAFLRFSFWSRDDYSPFVSLGRLRNFNQFWVEAKVFVHNDVPVIYFCITNSTQT